MSTNDARDAAIREAKRYIHEIVRNDWCFEPSTTSATGRSRFETSWPVDEQEVAEWRLRDYDDSCSELEPQAEDEEEDEEDEEVESQRDGEGGRVVMIGSGGESEGRRKRRRQMEEEMSWNEGLRTWMERRDAWSGARTRREIRSRRNDGKSHSVAANGEHHAGEDEAEGEEVKSTVQGIDPSAIDPSDLASKTESSLSISGKDGKTDTGAQADKEDDDKEKPLQPEESHPNHHHHHHHLHDHNPDQMTPLIPDEPYIPVVPSIISNTNPIRASITSSMYPSIYSKVIVQSLTPTVPINLADVTKAMVQGWKADGQWPAPPKHTSIVLQDDASVRKKDDSKAGVGVAGAAGAAGAAGSGASSPEAVKKKSGVASAVRKVLHFSGFHPHHHPFHRRGSSHGSSSQHQLGDGEAGPSNIH